MAFIKEAYSENRVDIIYELLKKEAAHGNAKDYDVSVDGLKAVSRNNNPERFFEFEEFVLPESKGITISIYERSHRCTRYILLLQPEEITTDGFAGTENSIEARMKQERTKWENKRLSEDYDALLQKLKECEEYARGLEQKVGDLEHEKSQNTGQITSTIIGLVGTALSKNPGALSGIPIIGSLFAGKKQQVALNGPQQECLCSMAPKIYSGELTVGDDRRMKMALVPYFKEEYREKVMKVLVHFFHYNHLIDQSINGIEALFKKAKPNTEQKAA